MLRLKNITRKFKNFCIEDFNLIVKKGEFVSILGSSGSGKTSILKIIAGLDNDYTGELTLNNKNYKDIKLKNRKISMVFQESLLFPHLNVEENVAFGLKMSGVNKKERIERSNQILTELNLYNFGKRRVYELSGGQKQRVAIARALVVEPQIILMDEPFSALDKNLRLNMQELIKKIQREKEVTIIFVTHDQEEAFYLANKIVILDRGKIKQQGNAREIYINPNSKFIAKFLGIKNIIAGKIKDKIFFNKNFSLNINYKNCENAILLIRGINIKIVKKNGDLKGKVEEIVFRNNFYYIKILVEKQFFYIIQNESYIESLIEEEIVQLKFDKNKINILEESL